MGRKKGDITPRDKPKYHSESFEKEKPQSLIKYVLGRDGWVVEVEGGKRGGKDVYGLYAWAQFLMVTPDKEHIALGRTLEHAIVTILKSQGFGIYYCIPSGEFVRESVSGGATRGVFKFTDSYGVEKIIYFYGNEKREDYAKFKGFTLGSAYINEANEQHIMGIKEVKDRTNASMRPRIIITQNPKADAHVFYTDFELPLINNDEENLMIRNVKSRFTDAFNSLKEEMLDDMEKERKELVRGFLKRRNVPDAKLLIKQDRLKLLAQVRELKETWNKKIRGVQVKYFTDDYNDPDDQSKWNIHNASMQLVINYVEQYPNPNDVYNGLNFAYFHFTHDDNLSMSDADRARVASSYDTTSPTFKREILGQRATVDNAIWGTFNDDNIYDYDPPYHKMTRVLGVDVGYDHPFGGLDIFIDRNNTLWVDDELFILPSREKEKANNVEYINRLKNFINLRVGGQYSHIRVDPSAKGFINQCNTSGLLALKAKNKVRNYKPDESKESDHTDDRKIVGINLVREGFRLNKIMVRKRCKNLIKQIQGYAYDEKKLELGQEVPIKINDDLCDPLRYVVNSEIGYVALWQGKEVKDDVESREKEVLEKQVSQDKDYDKQSQYAEQLISAFKGTNKNNSRWLF